MAVPVAVGAMAFGRCGCDVVLLHVTLLRSQAGYRVVAAVGREQEPKVGAENDARAPSKALGALSCPLISL